ncbi:MAG: HAD family hydrolase [Nanoarchaeota archaeon]|nr:HAD family hydrolase [Nanoarchaeota archaeon]
MIKVIAFDMWQTLGTYKFNLLEEALKLSGLNMSLEEFIHQKGKIKIRKDLDDKGRFVDKIRQLGVTDDSKLQKIEELYIDAHESIFLYNDALETLNGLKKRGKILVIITNVDAYAHNKIMKLFPRELFDFILASHEIGIKKPDKRIFLKLIEKFPVRSEEILMVGDSDEMDIKPAKLLGWKTAFISRNNKKSKYADYNLTSLRDLLQIAE